MAANGIDESHRDDFVRHAVKFDDDDNQYLKKAEIEAAAAAWTAADDGADSGEVEATEETEAADDATSEVSEDAPAEEEIATEEAPAEESEVTEEATVEETPTEESSTKIALFVVTQILKEQSPANLVGLHSDYKGYSQRGQAWSRVSSDTMMMTIRGKVRSISSRSCTAGGITPTLISTASHASGYCLSHASTSAIIPSGGTPGLTLAGNPNHWELLGLNQRIGIFYSIRQF